MKEPSNNTGRIEYFDFLRVLAAFSVILVHVNALPWVNMNIRSFTWVVLTIIDNVTRWAVPVFMMMSGAIFLENNYSIKKIITKNLFRILTAYIIWSALYLIISICNGEVSGTDIIFAFINGPGHFWYLPWIAIMYLLTPILQKITNSDQTVKYVLVLSFIMNSIIPQIMDTVALFSDLGLEILIAAYSKIAPGELFDVFYFLFGWYLANAEISKKQRHIIYMLGGAGLLYTTLITVFISIWKNYPINTFVVPYQATIVLFSTAIFVYAKYHFSYDKVGKAVKKAVQSLAYNSFGIYLVHVMVLECITKLFGEQLFAENTIFIVFLISILVLLISYIISAVIHTIPVLRKYMV